MNDILGRPVKVGDIVMFACTTRNGNAKRYAARVAKINPKTISVEMPPIFCSHYASKEVGLKVVQAEFGIVRFVEVENSLA